jgi:glycosyltransferase involved in cell wall biosynthesis
MKSNIITVIPVYNGEKFIGQTLQSVAAQTRRPDRLIVLDNCSTDNTQNIVKGFNGMACEYIRNPSNLGLFGNCNRALDFAPETNYLHLIPADDLIEPRFFEVMVPTLDSCDGFGLAFCLDERIDENNRTLSVSGKASGSVKTIEADAYIRSKAEIANQAFGATLLKTGGQPAPCRFRLDMPILADVAFHGEWAKHCRKIVKVNQTLMKFRWHGENMSCSLMPTIQALILDEWKVMQLNERLRKCPTGAVRAFKLKGLFAVRTGIKAKRIREQNNRSYSVEVVREGKKIAGPLAWHIGQVVVETRDLIVYGLLRRRKHPRNVYG